MGGDEAATGRRRRQTDTRARTTGGDGAATAPTWHSRPTDTGPDNGGRRGGDGGHIAARPTHQLSDVQ
eukprot:8977268-Pyramimonas_sp.AAC.1